ncbi:MAG: hypothetical protein AB1584_14015 [Pseudomonadota bacterium]
MNKEESLLYWVLMRLVEPIPGRALNARLKYVLCPDGGLSGDPGWTIDRSDNAGSISYEVISDLGYHDSPFSRRTYSDSIVRLATLRTLQAVAAAYPERQGEVLDTIREFGLAADGVSPQTGKT